MLSIAYPAFAMSAMVVVREKEAGAVVDGEDDGEGIGGLGS